MVSSISTVGHPNPFQWNRKSMASMKQCFNFLKRVINLLIYVSNLINILSIYPNRWSKSKDYTIPSWWSVLKGHAIQLIAVDHTDTKGDIFKRGNIIKLKGSIVLCEILAPESTWKASSSQMKPTSLKQTGHQTPKKPSGLTCSPWWLPHSFSQQEKQAWGFQLVHCSPNGNSCWVL